MASPLPGILQEQSVVGGTAGGAAAGLVHQLPLWRARKTKGVANA